MIGAGVSFGWVLGGASGSTFLGVGYGWLASAAYGVVLLVGLLAAHSEDVAAAVDVLDRSNN